MSLRIVSNRVPVGADLHRPDLARPLSEADLAQVRRALDDHGMIFARGQPLTPDQYVEFGTRLDTLRRNAFSQFLLPPHPAILLISNIVEDGKQTGVADAGQCWHTDGALDAEPHIYSVLDAQEIPHDVSGRPLGSTMFVSTAHAFETLDDATTVDLRGRRGFHSLIAQFEKKKLTGKGAHVPLTAEQKAHKLELPHVVERDTPDRPLGDQC